MIKNKENVIGYALIIDTTTNPYTIFLQELQKEEREGKLYFKVGDIQVPPPSSFLIFNNTACYPYLKIIDEHLNIHYVPITDLELKDVDKISLPADLKKIKEFYQQVIDDLEIASAFETENYNRYLFFAIIVFGILFLIVLGWGFNHVANSLKQIKVTVEQKITPVTNKTLKQPMW